MENANNPIQIVIADGHASFRQRLHCLLESTHDFYVAGEACDGATTIKLVRQLRPHLLLVDPSLPFRDELARLKGVEDLRIRLQIVVMLPSLEECQLVDALRLGAHGIVMKTANAMLLLRSIREVAAGNYFLSSEVMPVLMQMLRNSLGHENAASQYEDYALTPREIEIVAKIASGLSNKAVAQEFAISERTVKHHLTNIFSKVGVSNRLALALFAMNHPFMHGRTSKAADLGHIDSVRPLNEEAVPCLPD